VNGQLYRSDDQWQDDQYYDITPEETTGGDWVTPYVLHPMDQELIVAGYEEVFVSGSAGETWDAISNNLTGDPDNKLTCIAVAPTDIDVIYAGRAGRIYFTYDFGDTWESQAILIGGNNGTGTSSIVVHPTDPMKLWVTVDGYSNGKKVYYSENGGDDFTNISWNLPNVPVNASVIDMESPGYDLYIGTDVGVFLLNTETSQWDYYGAGIPNTSVTDLEIQYSSRKLRAATFGRGIWENDLASEPGVGISNYEPQYTNWCDIAINPVENELLLNIHTKNDIRGEAVICNIAGQEVWRDKVHFPVGNYQAGISVSALVPGTYVLRVESPGFPTRGIKWVRK
jgi:hypothetical protein